MTRIVPLTFFCFACLFGRAQQLVSSVGGTTTEQSGFVSWSVGEAVVASPSQSVIGFQQNVSTKITGVEDSVSARFSVYPNPAKDFIVIRFERTFDQEVRVRVYSLLQILQIEEVLPAFSNSIELNISKFTSGPYQILLVSPHSKPVWLRFIKL